MAGNDIYDLLVRSIILYDVMIYMMIGYDAMRDRSVESECKCMVVEGRKGSREGDPGQSLGGRWAGGRQFQSELV